MLLGSGPSRPASDGASGGGPEPGRVAVVDQSAGMEGQAPVNAPHPITPIVVPAKGGIDGIISGVAQQIQHTVKPAAAAAVATAFGFPLILMVAVLLFLLVQSRLDGRDPKLRAAPLTAAETILPFRDEDQL